MEGVPWFEHDLTKSGDPNYDNADIGIARFNLFHLSDPHIGTWKRFLFSDGHCHIVNLNGTFAVDLEKENRYFR